MQLSTFLFMGSVSLFALSALSISYTRAADIQSTPNQSSTTLSTTKPKHLPQSTSGFIPAKLGQSIFAFEGECNVLNKDTRTPVSSSKYPWSAIGRVELLNADQLDWICTGTLIGKNLVITNAHCVIDPKTQQITANKIRFRPNVIHGKASAEAFATEIVLGTNEPQRDRGNDWALLVLDQPLGETYGWMKFLIADLIDLDSVKGEMILAGYSSDFPKNNPSETAGVHKGCSIHGFSSQLGIILHDCDMPSGTSDGPLFTFAPDGSAVIVALNAAYRTMPNTPAGSKGQEFSSEPINTGVYAIRWAEKAEELLKGQ